MNQEISAFLLGGALFCGAVHGIVYFSLAYYLKDHWNDAWLRLGSPSFLNMAPLNKWRMFVFAFFGGYRKMPDAGVCTRCRWLQVTGWLGFLMMGGFVAGLIAAR